MACFFTKTEQIFHNSKYIVCQFYIQYTQANIVQLLHRGGLEKLTGKKVSFQMVDRLPSKYLKYYAGILSNKILDDGQEFEGKHMPMITKDEMITII